MKILGIHYFAPPSAVVASRRLSGIYRYLIDQGVSVDIITVNNHGAVPKEVAYEIDANLRTVAGGGLRDLLLGPQNRQVDSTTKSRPLFQTLNRYRQAFPLLYLTDEGGPTYYKNALQLARDIIPERGITHIFTSYRPWVDHRIGAALKATFPRLHWIADFRDLPVDPIRKDVGLAKYQAMFGKEIITKADELWVVSEGQRAQLTDWHPNIRIVYNGLTNLPKPTTPAPSDRFVINYSGSLYPDLQRGQPLREVMDTGGKLATSLVKKINLQYAGKDGSIWKSWFQPLEQSQPGIKVINRNIIPQIAAREAQRQAATNLLFSWSGQDYYGVLTAKLYDYLAAGRPITALVNGPDDPELRRIIEGSGSGRVFCHGQSAELVEWLETLLQDWQQNDGWLPWAANAEKLRPLLMREQLKDLPSSRNLPKP
ncbi:MAG: hypothetical protein AAGF89_14895 [Bacteroidota bacterium]